MRKEGTTVRERKDGRNEGGAVRIGRWVQGVKWRKEGKPKNKERKED